MDKDKITNKTMLINEAIAKLKHFAKLYGINSVFIAGGYCRSLYLDRVWETNDIDVASAYESQSTELGGLFASEVAKIVPTFYKKTNTAMMEYKSDLGSIKIEFQGRSTQSYMQNDEVKNWLRKNDIDDIPILHNIFGRDFTINSLIFSLHNENLYDLTNRAVHDFESKKIVSLLPANLIVKFNPIVILRAIRFALLYDFVIDGELENLIPQSLQNLLSSVSSDRILQEVVKILKVDGRKALHLIKRYELNELLLNDKIKDLLQ